MSDIGKKLYDRRKQLNLTLEQVGDAVGVGKSTVRKWENGMIKNMGIDKINALARVLQLDPVELVPYNKLESRLEVKQPKRLFAVDSMPTTLRASLEATGKTPPVYKIPDVVKVDEDAELKALLKLWKVAKPERRKDIIKIIKAMTMEDD